MHFRWEKNFSKVYVVGASSVGGVLINPLPLKNFKVWKKENTIFGMEVYSDLSTEWPQIF